MISLYSGTPGSYKSYHAVMESVQALRLGKNVITNFPLNYKKRIKKPIKGTYECVNNIDLTVDYLINFACDHHKPGTKAQTLVVIDEASNITVVILICMIEWTGLISLQIIVILILM